MYWKPCQASFETAARQFEERHRAVEDWHVRAFFLRACVLTLTIQPLTPEHGPRPACCADGDGPMSNPAEGSMRGPIRWTRTVLLGLAFAIPTVASVSYRLAQPEPPRAPNLFSMLLWNLRSRWFPPPRPTYFTIQATLNVPVDPGVDLATHQKAQVSMVRSERVLSRAVFTYGSLRQTRMPPGMQLVPWLQQQLEVDFSEGPEVLRIRMTGEAPVEAAALVNSIAVRYVVDRYDQVPASLRPTLRGRSTWESSPSRIRISSIQRTSSQEP
jgi:hypothetical protein